MILNQQQIDSFQENGFLAVENVLNAEDLQPLLEEYDALLSQITEELFLKGKLSSKYEGLAFSERYTEIARECPQCVDYLNISLPLVNGEVDPEHYRVHSGPAVFDLLRHPKILDLVEPFLGSEIASSPVLQMRIKPPLKKVASDCAAHSNVGLTTWHQDTVAVLPEANETNQITVWIAVTDASIENGCLASIAGSHKDGEHRHVPGLIPREPTVPESAINNRKGTPLPVKKGGVVIFHKQNIHCSLPNRSNQLRWSLDIRYHPVGQPSGRPAFPGFIARSRQDPSSVLSDAGIWAQMWQDARTRIVNGEYQGRLFRDWEND